MEIERTIDSKDLSILSILQDNARISNAEISRRVKLAPSAVLERIRRLEDDGIIEGYRPRVRPQALGLSLLAFVFVKVEELPGDESTGLAMASIPQVLEVHHIAGEDCYLVKIRARDTDELGQVLRRSFGAIPTVRSTRTTIVLNTVKEDFQIPVGAVDRFRDEG